MKTKEAIEFIESKKPSNFTGYELNNVRNEKITENKLCEIIELLQRGQKIEEGLIQFLEKENPYPEGVFLPIKKEDFNKINNWLKKELGYPIDRLSGNLGRKIYKSFIEEIKEVIK